MGKPRHPWVMAGGTGAIAVLLSSLLFLSHPRSTIRGVPVSIILQFLQDDTARTAYFAGDKHLLHDRLQEMGVEEEIKAFYRSQFPDEATLDLYIHQLLYDATGYVGTNYRVGADRKLVPKPYTEEEFWDWYRLARRTGIIVGLRYGDGSRYVISSQGDVVLYEVMARVFPIEALRELDQLKFQNPRSEKMKAIKGM